MTERELIERAIESAKCRIYRVRANVGESKAHQMKVEKQAELQQVTIKALEKQIAKKPIWKKSDFINRHHCPCCNEVVWIEHPYCVCGQKLDWGNEDA